MPSPTVFTDNDIVKRKQLTEAYRKSTPLEQKIIQLFSVIYEPVSKSIFAECFSQPGVWDESIEKLKPDSLKYRINKLTLATLLVQERGQSLTCHPLLVEIATRDAIAAKTFEVMVNAVQKSIPVRSSWKKGSRLFNSERQFIREVRIGIYRQDLAFINQQAENYEEFSYERNKISIVEVFRRVCNNPFECRWFCDLSLELYEAVITSILTASMMTCSPADEAFNQLLIDCTQPDGRGTDYLRLVLAEQCLLRGRLSDAEKSLEATADGYRDNTLVFWGWLSFLKGDHLAAIAYYTNGLKAFKKARGKRQTYFNTIAGLFFVFALLKEGSGDRLREATGYAELISNQTNHWLSVTYDWLKVSLQIQQGELAQKEHFAKVEVLDLSQAHSIQTLISSLCLYWIDSEQAKNRASRVLTPLYEQAKASGYQWLSMEAAELLSRLSSRGTYGKQAKTWRQDLGIGTLVDLIQRQETWEICLKALANLNAEPQKNAKTDLNMRLAWFITFYSKGSVIQPREQKINAKGVWSSGRNVAIKRLMQTSDFPYLTMQDLQVCSYIESYYTHGNYGLQYDFNEKAIAALIGHPLVFWEDSPTTRIEIVKGEPELLVKKGKQDYLILEFSAQPQADQEILVTKETPTRLKVIEIKPEHRRIAEIIGKQNRLEVPTAAKERVLAAINAVSSLITVHSDIGGGVGTAEEVPSEPTPHIHLLPAGSGLKVAVLARPFAQAGSYYRPGTGGETVIAEIDGKRLQTTRNLKEEKKLAKAAIAACPTLAVQEEQDREYLIEDPEQCLEFLLELQELGDRAIVEWPEGEKMRVSYSAGFSSFRMSIKRQNDWFTASGELQLDDDEVMDMQRLMELLGKTPSRFVPLGDGQFLALTQEFRKRLDEFRSFSEAHGKEMRFHPLATLALEDFIDEVADLKADKHWKEHIKRLKEMQDLQPVLPSTLQAELRDYQIEGFNWLARLAHWGVGACLADDMGLGKTLQALALLLTRAPEGATLILAPTSVCMNWISEAQRFAPTMNVIQLGSSDRQITLDQLQPFDMLVCSYGLLQQDEVAEMLANVTWQTIILDEAQAIKNTATKRSQAAMKLQGGFKLITTGTPIENHLGELWNLFRFINPGLLGSLERFNQDFANPIERSQDKQARHKLKKLIQPFLLRRTKSQVLQELPSRTEILLQVELSREEKALYETLRREAIAKLSDSDATAGAKHLQVLVEIMKLRRLCCNPNLVKPELGLSSSKLQLFGEVLEELLSNNHKTLVFSQFVDHLHIIRDYLDQQEISYQYLDGSTPAKERKKRVDAFQSGIGDVFLISLKAGGTGLNLTAADYVIHMDPWWNPAVEDQASDRAHRIGQQRPVTIYRLVGKDTIEEKIVDLHKHKRDLADSLLEGADVSGKISTDDLLRLIQTS